MYRVHEHYLGYWAFLQDFYTREEAEEFVEARKWWRPSREFDIEDL